MSEEEYDRQYTQARYTVYRKRRHQVLSTLFAGRCFLCGATEGFESFQLHHVEYHPTESNYGRQSDSQATKVRRLKEAAQNPERFRLLCNTCHRIVGTLGREVKRLGRKNKVDLDRLLFLVRREADNRTD